MLRSAPTEPAETVAPWHAFRLLQLLVGSIRRWTLRPGEAGNK
ncbi:hypothetical protein ACQPYH_05405 [Kribbella sp. CA-245084]